MWQNETQRVLLKNESAFDTATGTVERALLRNSKFMFYGGF